MSTTTAPPARTTAPAARRRPSDTLAGTGTMIRLVLRRNRPKPEKIEIKYTLKKDVPVYLYGGKPKHLKTIRKEVKALKRKGLRILEQGQTYKF